MNNEEQNILLKIYHGKIAHYHGILESDVSNSEIVEKLLSDNLVAHDNWYRNQLLTTTEPGDIKVTEILTQKINNFRLENIQHFQNRAIYFFN